MYQLPKNSTVINRNKYTQNLSQRLLPISEIDPDYFEFGKDQEFRKKISRDVKFRAAEENMLAEVAGVEWFLSDPLDQDNPSSDLYKFCLSQIKGFLGSRMCMAQSCLWGMSVLQIHGEFRFERIPGVSEKPTRIWVPTRLTDINRDRMRRSVHVIGEGEHVYRWNIFNPFSRQWEVIEDESGYIWSEYRPEEDRLGYGNGLGQSLYYCYKLMSILYELLALGAERWADSWIIAKVESLRTTENLLGDADTIDSIIDEIEKMRANGILVVDKEHDITTLGSVGGDGYRVITETIQELKKDILILLTGVNLVSQIDGGGSYAAAQAQAEQMTKRLTIFREMSVAEPLTDWLMSAIWRNNFHLIQRLGFGKYAIPKFNVSGGAVFNASERLPIFQFAIEQGIKISEQDIREQLQLSPVSKNTDIIEIKPKEEPRGFSFAADGQIIEDLKKRDASLPRELLDAIDDLTTDIFRRYQGGAVDMDQSQRKAMEKIRTLMAYYDIEGQIAAGRKIEEDSSDRSEVS